MFAAIVASLVFTFVVATLAAKSRKAELVILPALDILQSVPVLGFLTFTVTFFLRLFPGSELGAECAAIFAIFTSQAWNMAFSFYQSLRTVPRDLDEVSRAFPAARRGCASGGSRRRSPRPGLIWNTMMSMSGGWFFVVASEAITVGDTTVKLPGIGSWLARRDRRARTSAPSVLAVAAMAVVILLYDQLLFRPIVAWADKFRFEQTAAQRAAALLGLRPVAPRPADAAHRRSAMGWLAQPCVAAPSAARRRATQVTVRSSAARPVDIVWIVLVLAVVAYALWRIVLFTRASRSTGTTSLTAVGLGLLTLARVVVLIALASADLGAGRRVDRAAARGPPSACSRWRSSSPPSRPTCCSRSPSWRSSHWHLDPDIWLSPLMVLGTQWYILFNVIAGASAFPTDLREAATLFRLRPGSGGAR